MSSRKSYLDTVICNMQHLQSCTFSIIGTLHKFYTLPAEARSLCLQVRTVRDRDFVE